MQSSVIPFERKTVERASRLPAVCKFIFLCAGRHVKFMGWLAFSALLGHRRARWRTALPLRL
jgi:hypothetical protein